MPRITKIYGFCAAHQYWNPDWDKDKNYKAFGDDIKVHGHNYELEVTIGGPINPETGFIVDLQLVNEVVNTRVIRVLDHSRIEKDIPWFRGKQPSTEYLTRFIWDQIVDGIPKPAYLYRIKLKETPTIYTEYFGPERNKND